MGQKFKGGLWCDACQKPVMRVKNTHRIRNAMSVAAIPATNVLSLAGAKVEGYVCPNCGGKVRARKRSAANSGSVAGFLNMVGLLLALAAWLVLTLLFLVTFIVCLPHRWRTHRSTSAEIGLSSALRSIGEWMKNTSQSV